jgi:hypothetical protein
MPQNIYDRSAEHILAALPESAPGRRGARTIVVAEGESQHAKLARG